MTEYLLSRDFMNVYFALTRLQSTPRLPLVYLVLRSLVLTAPCVGEALFAALSMPYVRYWVRCIA